MAIRDRVSLTGWVLLYGVASTGSAAANTTDIVLDEQALLFGEIPSVYTASKFEQKITDAPSSVSIVTAEEIKRYGYRTLADILRSLRSLVTTYDRNYTYVGGRGFALPGDYNSRILFLVDGVRINDPVYGQSLVGTDSVLDIDLIDRIEFVRGPASSLYGADAMFGVLNIVTKRGRDIEGTEVSAAGASLDTQRGRLTFGKRYSDGFEVIASGSVYQSDGQNRLYYPEFDDPLTNNGVAEDRDSDRFKSFFTRMGFGDLTFEAGYVDRTKDIPTASFGTVFNHPDNHTEDKQGFASLTYQRSIADGTDLTARLYYNRSYYDATYMFDLSETGDLSYVVPNTDYSRGQRAGAEVFACRWVGDRHHVTVGTEYRNDFQLDQVNYDVEVYVDDHRDSTAWAAYIQDQIQATERLLLNLGLRYDRYDIFGDTVNPRIGAVYRLHETTWLKALYGTGFRAPTPYELYYVEDTTRAIAALHLEPEKIRTTELVLEHYFHPQILGTLALFTHKHENLIGVKTVPETGLLVYHNAEESVRVTGAEAELEGPFGNGWRGRISYAYTDEGNFDDVSVVSYAPRHLAKLNVIAPVVHGVFAGFELLYTGARPAIGGTSVPAFTIANLTLSGRTPIKGLELSASVYNLFDERYSDPVSEELEQTAVEQDGRAYLLKLIQRF